MVKTWDENVFTLAAAPELDDSRVAVDDVVLLDYYPDDAFDLPAPKQVVAAVLDGEKAESVWEKYRDLYENSKGQQTGQMQFPNQPFEGGYIG